MLFWPFVSNIKTSLTCVFQNVMKFFLLCQSMGEMAEASLKAIAAPMVVTQRVGRKNPTFCMTPKKTLMYYGIIAQHTVFYDFTLFYFHCVMQFNPLNFKKQKDKDIHRTSRKIHLFYILVVLSFILLKSYKKASFCFSLEMFPTLSYSDTWLVCVSVDTSYQMRISLSWYNLFLKLELFLPLYRKLHFGVPLEEEQ